MEKEIIIPAEVPSAVPEMSFGEVLRWAPVLSQIISTIETAISGGATEIPPIKLPVNGRKVILGPIPITVG